MCGYHTNYPIGYPGNKLPGYGSLGLILEGVFSVETLILAVGHTNILSIMKAHFCIGFVFFSCRSTARLAKLFWFYLWCFTDAVVL